MKLPSVPFELPRDVDWRSPDTLRRVVLILCLVVYVSFIASIFLLRPVDQVPPDSYFLFNNLPITYWIGIVCILALILLVVIREQVMDHTLGDLITATVVVMLPSNIFAIPRLIYKNVIYTDTFQFVAQTLYVQKTGHSVIGNETPGLISYMSGILVDITGFDLITYAKYSPIFISIFISLMIYALSRIILKDRRYPLVSVLAFHALSWTGLAYNRQSFAFIYQYLAWMLIVKLSLQKYDRPTVIQYLFVLSALTISHPASSLVISLTPFMVILAKKVLETLEPEKDWSALRMNPTLAILSSVSWLLWQINFAASFTALIEQFKITSTNFLGEPDPIAHAVVSGYTPSYLIIANLRQYSSYYILLTGLLFFLLTIRKDINMKMALSLFSLCVSPFPFVLYANRWRMIPFMYAILPWAIMFAGALKYLKPPEGRLYEVLAERGKTILLLSLVFFLLLVPLTMYGPTAHMYPPSTELSMMDYLTANGKGSIAVIDPGTTISTYYEADRIDNEVVYITRFPFLDETGLDLENVQWFQIIIPTFRAYSKAAYIQTRPMYDVATDNFVDMLNDHTSYARVFDSDDWHVAFSRVK